MTHLSHLSRQIRANPRRRFPVIEAKIYVDTGSTIDSASVSAQIFDGKTGQPLCAYYSGQAPHTFGGAWLLAEAWLGEHVLQECSSWAMQRLF